jgi:hypothetical protein
MAAHELPPISAALVAHKLIITHKEGNGVSTMQDVAADNAKNSGQKTRELTLSRENTALDHRYRQIGISAVAAAVRYQGDAKNPAYAPVSSKWRDLAGDAA